MWLKLKFLRQRAAWNSLKQFFEIFKSNQSNFLSGNFLFATNTNTK